MVNKLTRKQERVANEIDRELNELYYDWDIVTEDIEIFFKRAILLVLVSLSLFLLEYIPLFFLMVVIILLSLRYFTLVRRKKNIDYHINRKLDVLGRITSKIDTRGSDVWQALRSKILKRDKHTCQDCGIKNTFINWFIQRIELHVHHIKPVAESGTNDFKNLETLCRSCHKKIHPWMR